MSDAPAIIKATYATWKPVPTRKVLQLVFEIPIEQTEQAMKTLGVPTNETSTWVAIARLTADAAEGPRQDKTVVPIKSGSKWDDLSPTTQSGIRCQDPNFQAWVGVISDLRTTPDGEEIAKKHVLARCKIMSRKELSTNPEAAKLWKKMDDAFILESRWGVQ